MTDASDIPASDIPIGNVPARDIPLSRVSLGSPAELVAAVPYLLGFRPHRSLVAVGMAANRHRVTVCGRADWPAGTGAAAAGALAAQLSSAGSASAVIIAYPGAVGGGRRVAETAAGLFELTGLRVLDVLEVRGGRMRSYRCRDRACCPCAVPPSSLALQAAMVAQGRRVLADRAELVAVLGPPPATLAPVPPPRSRRSPAASPAASSAASPAASSTASPAASLAEIEDAVGGLPQRVPAQAQLVRWATALRERPVRDGCLVHLRGERSAAAEALWLAMVRVAPRPLGAAPACLLALHAYIRGDGAFARVCLERALEHDPGEPLAHDLHALLDLGVPPDQVLFGMGEPGERR